MKTSVKVTLFLALVMSPLISRAQTVTVDNAGFQTPDESGLLGGLKEYNYNSVTPTYLSGTSGWYVSAGTQGDGSVTIVNQGVLGAILSGITNDGSSQYIALNGLAVSLGVLTPGALGGVSQVISTTPGQAYEVDYLAGALSIGLGNASLQPLSAGVDGVTVTSSSGGALLGLNVGTFTNESFTFTANSTQSVLDFYEPSALIANVGGVAIDNVSVTAVPEPSHSTVILLGCVALLTLYRRLNRTNAFINGEKVSC